MTAVKLKDIEGCLVAKKVKYRSFPLEDWENGFNDAISTQGEVQITLNREKMAKTIFNSTDEYWIKAQYLKKTLKGWRLKEHSLLKKLNISYSIADAIIKELPELVEVVR